MTAAAPQRIVRGHLPPDTPGHIQPVRIKLRWRIDHPCRVPDQVARGTDHVHDAGHKRLRHVAVGALCPHAGRIGEMDGVPVVVSHPLHLVARGAERVGGNHRGDTFIAAPDEETAQQSNEQGTNEAINPQGQGISNV